MTLFTALIIGYVVTTITAFMGLWLSCWWIQHYQHIRARLLGEPQGASALS